MKDKILIIGASRLLGKKLYDVGKKKYDVFGTYNKHKLQGKTLFHLDVTDKTDVFNLINKIKPNLVIDTHSITNVDYCELHKDDAWNINVVGLRNIAEVCKIFGSKLIFISTDYVFDGKKLNYGEKDKLNPLNYYGKTKAISEKILELLGTNYTILRTSVIYGVGSQGKQTFVSWVLEKLRANKEIKVVIDQFNKPTLVDDLANISYLLYEKDIGGLFHAVGKDLISRYEFAKQIARHFNLNQNLIKPTTSSELNQVAIRPRKLNLSTNKLERVLKTIPRGIEEGLKLIKEKGEI